MVKKTKFVFPGNGSIRLWGALTGLALAGSLVGVGPDVPPLDHVNRYQVPIAITSLYVGGYILLNAAIFVIRGFEQDTQNE